MGMKVKLSNSFLSPKHYLHSSCTHSPKTLSFRSPPNSDHVFKTLNSVYFDSSHESSDDDDEEEEEEDNEIELIIRGARSETSRLLFQPSLAKAISDSAESEMALPGRFSKLNRPDKENEDKDEDEDEEEDGEEVGPGPFKESVVMAMESEDPYMDFKRSMEEMVETHRLLKDWGSLEELLAWYLKVNGKKNHAYIVAAFVDLLVKFSSSSSSSSSSCSGVLSSPKLNHEGCSNSSTSRSSSRSTSCACICGDHDRRHRMGNKSTTSFSSAASSFSL